MKVFNVTIVGDTPLMQNRFQEEPGAAKSTRRNTPTEREGPREQATKAANKLSTGEFFFPGAAIGRLLREVGSNHKATGSRKSLKYIMPAAVLVLNEAVVILDPDTKKPIKDFEVDSRPVVIPATKGRIMRHRPRFDKWSATFSIRINEDVLDEKLVQKFLTEGGQQNGIGEFRPEKGGQYGMFQVTSWTPIEK